MCNYFQFYFLARNVLCLTGFVFTLLEAVFSQYYCDMHYFLLIGVMFTFYLFPDKERRYSYFVAVCFGAAFIAVEIYMACNSPFQSPPAFIMNLKHVVRSALLLLTFFFAYYSYKTIRRFQVKLKAENRKMEKEISLARNIQVHIIPARDPIEYMYSLYKPMEQVGGDFYDYLFFSDSDKIGIFLSDVSGHGVPAAFITSMIKTAILQSGPVKHDPSRLLMFLNDILIQQSGSNYVTALYCIYNPTGRTLLFSSAGHTRPYLIDASGVVELTGDKCIALAIMNNENLVKHNKTFTNTEISLEKNSKLLLYTDGLTEARSKVNREIFFETAGIEQLFLNYHSLPCKEFVMSIYNNLIEFNGSENFEDDICMICLDVK